MKQEAFAMKECLLKGDFSSFVETMRTGWESKKSSAKTVSTPHIEQIYDAAMQAGALAGAALWCFLCRQKKEWLWAGHYAAFKVRSTIAILRSMARRLGGFLEELYCLRGWLMDVVILAGGLGTRLREAVRDLPKPMAMVAGRPFLEYVLDWLIFSGITSITLSVGYKADMIRQYFGNTYRNAVLKYVVENEPLGTVGAIAFALHGKGKESVLVFNGDTFLNIDYGKLINWYAQKPTAVAMVLREMSDTGRYGSVVVSGDRVSGFVEKGMAGVGLINAGVYILQPDIFTAFRLSGKFSFETDLLQAHFSELSPRAFISSNYFIDIGLPADYERAQYELPALTLLPL